MQNPELVSFKLDLSEKDKLEHIAKLHDTTISEILRKMVTLFLNSEKFQTDVLKETRFK